MCFTYTCRPSSVVLRTFHILKFDWYSITIFITDELSLLKFPEITFEKNGAFLVNDYLLCNLSLFPGTQPYISFLDSASLTRPIKGRNKPDMWLHEKDGSQEASHLFIDLHALELSVIVIMSHDQRIFVKSMTSADAFACQSSEQWNWEACQPGVHWTFTYFFTTMTKCVMMSCDANETRMRFVSKRSVQVGTSSEYILRWEGLSGQRSLETAGLGKGACTRVGLFRG